MDNKDLAMKIERLEQRIKDLENPYFGLVKKYEEKEGG